MVTHRTLLGTTAAAALLAAPLLAFGPSLAFGQTAPTGSAMQRSTAGTDTPANPGTPGTGPISPGPTGTGATSTGATSTGATSTGPTGTGPTGTSQAGTSTTSTGTPSATAGAAPSGTAMQVDTMRLAQGQRASKVIGATIYNENNESIGSVDDLIVASAGQNAAPVAILSVGGFLGIGSKLVAVPFDRLQWNGDSNRWLLVGATKDSLTALPTFAYNSVGSNR
ncbi:PRC-barrel domain-containing protein [Roseomonas sp. NAR14]|uniref:PRC-barrel domain-containing protein n=1 Tax=Roseomonas acroporae TaxID=2937791 RepID=A0A9X1YAJ3_9PROT|nr:PRC-barrel domain-containing protein [Roseomonas acroporae]MCK8786130.1 PRC-barrel domain-containing protein [Roseomonas acroporae]